MARSVRDQLRRGRPVKEIGTFRIARLLGGPSDLLIERALKGA